MKIKAAYLTNAVNVHPFAGNKTLTNEKFPGIKLEVVDGCLYATHKGEVVIIPLSNVEAMMVANTTPIKK